MSYWYRICPFSDFSQFGKTTTTKRTSPRQSLHFGGRIKSEFADYRSCWSEYANQRINYAQRLRGGGGSLPKFAPRYWFLSKNHAFINYKDHSVSFYDGLLISPLHAFNSISNSAIIKQTACIAAYSEAIIPVQMPQTDRSEENIYHSAQHLCWSEVT